MKIANYQKTDSNKNRTDYFHQKVNQGELEDSFNEDYDFNDTDEGVKGRQIDLDLFQIIIKEKCQEQFKILKKTSLPNQIIHLSERISQ